MQFRRYELDFIKSNMYVAVEDGHALLIDPVQSREAVRFLCESRARDALILLTHEHYDHTCGVNAIRKALPDSHLVCTQVCAEIISDLRKNRPHTLVGLLKKYGREELTAFYRSIGNYTCTADETFEKELSLFWAGRGLHLYATPGHSPGGCCIEMEGGYVFTGDSLIPNTPVITRFPGGSLDAYETITLPYLRSIDRNAWIMPGHGIPCRMNEFYQKDPRFIGLK